MNKSKSLIAILGALTAICIGSFAVRRCKDKEKAK